MATDVAKTEQITNTTVDAKEPQTVAENSATPPVEAEKAIPNANAAKDDKSETPVVNGDATAKEDEKAATLPATSGKTKQNNFFTKLKKQISFKNINIIKKKKTPKEPINEDKEEAPTTEKAEDTNKEKGASDDKNDNKVEPDKKDDTSTSKAAEVKKEEQKSTTPADPAKPSDAKVENTTKEEKKVEEPATVTAAAATTTDAKQTVDAGKPEVKVEVPAADEKKSAETSK